MNLSIFRQFTLKQAHQSLLASGRRSDLPCFTNMVR